MAADTPLKTRLTLTEFHELLKQRGHDKGIELIDGAVWETELTEQRGVLLAHIGGQLGNYLKQAKRGRIAVSVRIELPDDLINSRLPDLSLFLSPLRPVMPTFLPYLPDIIVEIKTLDEPRSIFRSKMDYYLERGCKEVWLVYPSRRKIEILTLGDSCLYSQADTLTSEHLPDFSLDVGELFNYEDFE